jgi:transcription-repair coupling factor (superfamily II helicase)
MDRLLCGDVGYGKTEVAMRAAMKCILDNKQVAFLCPTTVLANQHYQTAIQRFSGFPVTIKIISRFQTGKELKKTLENMRSGKTDIVIGTHRLLQKDIEFKNLGLLIVDEEQRFGVTHKEHIKEMSKGIDVLTLSATPIPRTLNMSLSGIRDMSIIEEPPRDRQPVQTFVMEHDWDVVGDAMRKELIRGGQIYYVHNRIDTIERTARKLHEILGEDVAIGVAHGRMDKNQLSGIMERMADGEIQILLCTTIIETGIDIPNVNTLVIEDADRMGLAQLHQLRGRVGRGEYESSCILITDNTGEECKHRMKTMCKTTDGFKISEEDLRLRGPGDFFGSKQHGLPPLKIADIAVNMELMSKAQQCAREILNADPFLDKPEHRALKMDTIRLFRKEIIG